VARAVFVAPAVSSANRSGASTTDPGQPQGVDPTPPGAARAYAATRDALLAAYIRAHPAVAEARLGTGPPGPVRVRRDYLEKIRQRDAARAAPREFSASRGRGG